MAITLTKAQSPLEELSQLPDNAKGEILHERVAIMSPTGDALGYAGGEIFAHLRDYARRTSIGRAVPDNVGFVVNLPHRKSFSPDVAYYIGPRASMKFYSGAPIFAVEIRSENDYGPKAEQNMAAKRADYFAAGTQVVWDVDLLSQEVIKVYRANAPTQSQVYGRDDIAEAEPAVLAWTMPIADLFD